ncbi:hypothetical protein ACA910_013497 [Epithemia clementina (nom. ined.)]
MTKVKKRLSDLQMSINSDDGGALPNPSGPLFSSLSPLIEWMGFSNRGSVAGGGPHAQNLTVALLEQQPNTTTLDLESQQQSQPAEALLSVDVESLQAKEKHCIRHIWIARQIRQHYQSTIAQVPPKYKWLCLVVWVAWKFVAVYLVYYFITPTTGTIKSTEMQWIPSILPHDLVVAAHHPIGMNSPQQQQQQQPPADNKPAAPGSSAVVRVLYIVTSTVPTSNKATSSLYEALPLLRHNVATILQQGFHVDVVWILESPTASDIQGQVDIAPMLSVIRSAFPSQVDLSIWPQATPLVPDQDTGLLVQDNSQQHQAWWVIRDSFAFYHVFMVWPDTARVLGSHVHHFWTMSQQLLIQEKNNDKQRINLRQLIPGFVPVFPHASIPTANRTQRAHLRMARQDHKDELDQWTAQSQTTWSSEGMTMGPIFQMPNAETNSTRSHAVPTVVVSPADLSSNTGFIVTRSQLAEHGLLECLFPPIADAIPILDPSQNDKAQTAHGRIHACHTPGPALLVATDIAKHVVQFVRSYDSKTSSHATRSIANFMQSVESLTQISSIAKNTTNTQRSAAARSKKAAVAK